MCSPPAAALGKEKAAPAPIVFPRPLSSAYLSHPCVVGAWRQSPFVDQRKSLEAYDTVFGGADDYSVIAERTVEEIISRFNFH